MTHKPLKAATVKNVFYRGYVIGTNRSDKYFVFYVITGNDDL